MRYKSSLRMLQKFPTLQKFPNFVTKVPCFSYKSALIFWLSLSLSLSEDSAHDIVSTNN